MTQVDFYILTNPTFQGCEQLACRLAEKAYMKGHYVYIHTTDDQQAKQVDNLLWTFRDGSFVPHTRIEEAGDAPQQILIGHSSEPPLEQDVLINLSHEVPLFFSRFLRVAEIVGGDEQQKQQARTRFKFYRDRGYPLNTYNIEL